MLNLDVLDVLNHYIFFTLIIIFHHNLNKIHITLGENNIELQELIVENEYSAFQPRIHAERVWYNSSKMNIFNFFFISGKKNQNQKLLLHFDFFS